MAIRGMSSEIAVVRQVSGGDTVFAGAVAGMVAGVLLALVAMINAAITGMDILSPVRLIAATFVGAGALEGGAATFGFGFFLHLLASMAWGILFASLLPRDTPIAAAVIAGLSYGLLVMLLMHYVVLPFANPLMREAVGGTRAFAIEHLVYGAALGLVPVFRRRFAVHSP